MTLQVVVTRVQDMAEAVVVLMEVKAPVLVARKEEAVAVVAAAARMMVAVTAGWMIHAVALGEEAAVEEEVRVAVVVEAVVEVRLLIV